MAFSIGGKGDGNMSEINVTPMIDILLVVLVIFMIIVPRISNGLPAEVPQPPKHEQEQSAERAIVVQVLYRPSQTPTFKINGTQIDNGMGGPVAENDLKQELTQIYADRGTRVMFIKADPRVDFQWVANVISIARAADVNHVGLLTPKDQVGLS